MPFNFTFKGRKSNINCLKSKENHVEFQKIPVSRYNPNIVKLNIGGTVFETSNSTLTRFDGFFKTMVESEITTTPAEIFIDRSPKYFDKILNFVRDGGHVVLPNSEEEHAEILKEAKFYGLVGLVEICQKAKKRVKVRHLHKDEEVLDAVVTCQKKAVIIIYYVGYGGRESTAVMAKHINKYSDEFDVYLKHHYPLSTWRYDIIVTDTDETYTGEIDYLEGEILKIFGGKGQ